MGSQSETQTSSSASSKQCPSNNPRSSLSPRPSPAHTAGARSGAALCLSGRYNDPRPSLTRPIRGALLFSVLLPTRSHPCCAALISLRPAIIRFLGWDGCRGYFYWGTLHWQRERLVARAHCDGRAFVACSCVRAAQHTGQKLKLRGTSRNRVSQPSAFAGRDDGAPRPVIALRGESRLPPPLPGCKTTDHLFLGR